MPYEGEFASYKPLQRISESARVQSLLKRVKVNDQSAQPAALTTVSLPQLKPSDWTPDYVIAVDGSFAEVPVKKGYPSAALGYVTVASVMLDVAKMLQLDAQRPVDPKEFRTIENAESIDGALPGSNVILDNEPDAKASFRRALFELFGSKRMSEQGECILETYEALLDLKPSDTQNCPYENCEGAGEYLRGKGQYLCTCSQMNPLYSTDALRTHEFMNPEGSNPSMLTETMTVLERVWIVHVLRTLEKEGMLPVLQRLAIVLDGPLAVFGAPAWLSNAIRIELNRINQVARSAIGDPTFNLLICGIEKTGPFVEHLSDLDKGPNGEMNHIAPQTALLLTDEYIKRHIILSNSPDIYGRNTYFGRKAFYKAASGALLVFTSPFLDEDHRNLRRAEPSQYPRLADTMSLLDKLVSARYRNSVTPIISAHAEAAIPMNLGKRVLENLARQLNSHLQKK